MAVKKEQNEGKKTTLSKGKVAKASAKPQNVHPKKTEVVVVRSKRKEAVARASIRKGTGIVRINAMNMSSVDNPYTKTIMSEPLTMIDDALAKGVDIDVDVYGGGQMGQAQAVRSAIARALVAFTNDSKLREEFHKRDKFLVVEDSRRVEPKKYKGPKARARFQKSYR